MEPVVVLRLEMVGWNLGCGKSGDGRMEPEVVVRLEMLEWNMWFW